MLLFQPDVQQRLREEIKEFLKTNNNQITYENISELKYLDMCCQGIILLNSYYLSRNVKEFLSSFPPQRLCECIHHWPTSIASVARISTLWNQFLVSRFHGDFPFTFPPSHCNVMRNTFRIRQNTIQNGSVRRRRGLFQATLIFLLDWGHASVLESDLD